MKKVLSLVLAVLMVMGTLTVASFAYDESLLPIFPAQTEGRIYFSAENVAIPTGAGTYDVPVYLVSNYTPDVELSEDAFVELGFQATITGDTNNYVTINGITVADEVKTLSNYATLDALLCTEPDDCHGSVGNIYYAFASGLDALKQSKLKVATISVTVSEEFPGGDYAPFITLLPYEITYVPVGVYTLFDTDVQPAGIIYDMPFLPEYTEDFYEEENYAVALMPASYDLETGELVGEVFVENGALYEKPAQPSWKDRLLFWVKKTVFALMARIESFNATVSEYFEVIRGALDMAIKGEVVLDNPVETPVEDPVEPPVEDPVVTPEV